MQQTDSAPQSCGANQNSSPFQNDSAWQNNSKNQDNTNQQNENNPKRVSLAVRIWRGVKFLVKWLWLLTMFILGIGLCLLMQSEIFEYSYSLSELDLAETLFIVGLLWFAFHYIKLCCRIDAPLVRKIITPFVHQAHVFLVAFIGLLIYAAANDTTVDNYASMPMLDVADYLLTMATLGYSYHRLGTLSSVQPVSAVPLPAEPATASSVNGFAANVNQCPTVKMGGAE